MTSIAYSPESHQISSQSVPSPPCWLGEVVLIVEHLRKLGVLSALSEQVRFARQRFGLYEMIDFVAVLFGYAISGERTLEAFYKALLPWADPFMALFGRKGLPARSTLSRFLAALTPQATEALRTLFLKDLLARPLSKERQTGELLDREGKPRVVFDIDGTREAARQRAEPVHPELPTREPSLEPCLCPRLHRPQAWGGRPHPDHRLSLAHSYQWLGSFSNEGLGLYREELRRAVEAIGSYLAAHQLPQECTLVRLDGQYGTGAVLADLAGLPFVMRGKDYARLGSR